MIPQRRQNKWGEFNKFPVYSLKVAVRLQFRERNPDKAQHSLGELRRKRSEFREGKGARNYKIGYQK